MPRSSRSKMILGMATAVALTTAGWLTAGSALADTPTPDATDSSVPTESPAPSSDPTAPDPTSTDPTSPDPTSSETPGDPVVPDPTPDTVVPHIAKPPSAGHAVHPRETAGAGTTSGNSFASAVTLNASSDLYWPYVNFDNTGATIQSGEPRKIGPGYFIARSMWAKWKAPVSGYVTVSATGTSGFDAGLNVYTGSKVNKLKRVAWGDQQYFPVAGAAGDVSDLPPNGAAGILSLKVTAGVTYYFQVGNSQSSPSATASGAGVSSLFLSIDPNRYAAKNDFLSSAQTLKWAAGSSATTTTVGMLQGATIESWEPTDNDESGDLRDASVWYKFVAPQTGGAAISSCGYVPSTVAVFTSHVNAEYTGEGWGDLKAIGFDEGGATCANPSQNGGFLLFPIKEGKTYWVQIAHTTDSNAFQAVTVKLQGIFIANPYLDKLSKTSGKKNDTVTLSAFGLVFGTNIVKFGTKTATIVSSTPTSITVKVPAQSKKGNFSVTIVNTAPTPDDVSNKITFKYK